jgi:holo-[acyl-carrier protein] synthase
LTIHGVGIDVVDTHRVERLLARSTRFARRWFTPDEVEQCLGVNGPAQAYAQRLAAKEAVWKALGLDDWTGGVPWLHIGTSHGVAGFTVELTGSVAEACADIALGRIHVAVVDSSDCTLAVAVVEGATRRSLA